MHPGKKQMGIFLFFLLPSGFFKEPKSLSSKCYRLVALILFPVPGMEPSFKPLAHGPCLRIGNPILIQIIDCEIHRNRFNTESERNNENESKREKRTYSANPAAAP